MDAFCCYDVGNLRMSLCYGSRFVKGYYLNLPRFFHGGSRFKQYTAPGTFAAAGHNSYRRCQSQCARTAYHQHRYAPCQCKSHALSCCKPHCQSQQRYCHNGRYKYSGYFVSYFGNRGFGGCRIADKPDNLSQRSIFTYSYSSAFKITRSVYGCRRYAVSLSLFGRYAFTGKG